MSKKCSIDHKRPTLARLMNKYGDVRGFAIYYKESAKNGQLDDTIEDKYLSELRDAPVNSRNKYKTDPQSRRGHSAQTEAIEEALGLAGWVAKKGLNKRSYKQLSDRQVNDNLVKARKYLKEEGLSDQYEAVKALSKTKGKLEVRVRPKEGVDFLVENANVPFVDELRRRTQALSKENQDLTKERRAGNITEAREREILERQRILNDQLEGLDQDIYNYHKSFNINNLMTRLEADHAFMEDFLSKEELTYEEIRQAVDKLEIWEAASQAPVQGVHPFLDEGEINNKQAVEEVTGKSRDYYLRYADPIAERRNAAIVAFTREHTISDNMSDQQILEVLKDMNVLRAGVLNIGQAEQPLLQGVFSAITKANLKFQQQADADLKKLTELAKDISEDTLDAMYQKDAEGRHTGRLVNPYSLEYYNERQNVISAVASAKAELDSLPENSSDIIIANAKKRLQNAHKKQAAWYKKNQMNISPVGVIVDEDTTDGVLPAEYLDDRAVGDDSETNLRAQLVERVGERQADNIIKGVKSRAKKFQAARDAYYLDLLGSRSPEQGLDEYSKDLFEFWLEQHSPYKILESGRRLATFKDKAGFTKKSYARYKYVSAIPNPNEERFYDKNYQTVLADPNAAELYDLFRTFMAEGRDMLGDVDGFLTGLSIPLLEESLSRQMFQEQGLLAARGLMTDSIIKSLRDTKNSSNENKRINPATNRETKTTNVSSLSQNIISRQVKERQDELIEEYKENNPGKAITLDIKRELKKDALDQVYRSSATNIIGAMAMYRVNSLMAGNRRVLEPHMSIIKNYVAELEVEEGSIGLVEGVKNVLGKNKTKEKQKATNMAEALDHYLDESLYGLSTKKKGATLGKVLTSEEKEKAKSITKRLEDIVERQDELKEKMSQGDYLTADEEAEFDRLEERRKFLEKEFENIGGEISATKAADGLLRLTQALGIGFSVPSAVANTGFGYVANMIEGGRGRDYNVRNLQRAYAMTMGSVSTSPETYSGDRVATRNTINELSKKYAIGTPPIEQRPQTNYRKFGKKNIFGRVRSGRSLEETAYVMMEKTEYINQATQMTAMMLSTEVIMKDGTKTNLLEVYNNPDLSVDNVAEYKIYGGDNFRKFDELQFIVYVKNVIHRTHGDYDNKIMFKNNLLGRALSQYRTWMYRTVADRFDTERYDGIGGYTTKGRYRSAVPMGILPFFNALIPPVIFARTKDQSKRKEVSLKDKAGTSLKNTLSTTKTFASSFLKNPFKFNKIMKEKLQEEYEKVDAENISAAYTEWIAYLTIALMSKLLVLWASKSLDDEDELTAQKGAVIFALNMLKRFEGDLSFYVNPLEASRLVQNPIPAYYLQDKGSRLFDSLGRIFDDRPMEIQSGIYEGWWWPARDAVKLAPGVAGLDKIYRNMSADISTGRKVKDDFTVFSRGDVYDKALGIDKKED
jgi:hypothetical protein